MPVDRDVLSKTFIKAYLLIRSRQIQRLVNFSPSLNSTNNCSGLGKGCWSTSKTDFTLVNLIAANANALIRLNSGKSFVFPE